VVAFGGLRAVDGVSLGAEPGSIVWADRRQRLGQDHDARRGVGQRQTDRRHGARRRDRPDRLPPRGADRRRYGPVLPGLPPVSPNSRSRTVLLICEDARHSVGVVSSTLQMPWARRSERQKRQAVDRVIGSFGLGRFRHHRQRLSCRRDPAGGGSGLDRPGRPPTPVARRADGGHRPTRGRGVSSRWLRRLHEVADCTIVLVEHDVPLVFELCSTVVVMESGRVVSSGTPDEVSRDPRALARVPGGQ